MTPSPDITEVFLQPGEFHFDHAKTRIKTILGSCVAITMWHPILRIGGMCHYLLPSRDSRVAESLDGRYGRDALQLFLAEMAKRRTALTEYQVKVFGGGSMFPVRDTQGTALEIGARNIELARKGLEDLGVSVVAEHVGDSGHRHVMFDIWSGDVWVRHQRMVGTAGPDMMGAT